MNSTPNGFSMTPRRVPRTTLCMAMLCGAAGMANGAPGDTRLISVTATSSEAAGLSNLEGNRAISADGRFVVFAADAATLVPNDSGLYRDVFVRDRQTGQTRRVSVAPSGAEGNDGSERPCISANGRFVAFTSRASNLVAGDHNNDWDVFLRDLQTGVTRRIGSDAGGPALSADGRFVAYTRLASAGVFIFDRMTGVTEPVSVGMDGTVSAAFSGEPSLSADGRYVAFRSNATNLVPGGNTGVFVRDRQNAVTELISIGSNGAPGNRASEAPSISADGRYVAFHSWSFNLVPGDLNNSTDIFVRDRQNRTTALVSRNSGGILGNGISKTPAISDDGRFVAFWSQASNLAPEGDTNDRGDIFVRDRQLGTTERVNVSSSGVETPVLFSPSGHPSINADGRFVAFESRAWNLVANDFNDSYDVYVHERGSTAVIFAFAVTPKSLAFGEQVLNTSRTLSFWLRNKGTTPLPIASIGLGGPDRAMFRLANRCSASVPVGMGCSIKVTFTPTSVGVKAANLRVVAGDNALRIYQITGTGVR